MDLATHLATFIVTTVPGTGRQVAEFPMNTAQCGADGGRSVNESTLIIHQWPQTST